MHALEKILARGAGLDHVKTGDIINCHVDLAGINDIYLQTVYSFKEMGNEKVYDPNQVIVFFDHCAPPSSIIQAENQKKFREFCREQNIKFLMDINEGVCHQVLADKGMSAPGKIIVITDSHTTIHGAFGAFGTGVGATDLAVIMATGQLWFRVPEIIKIQLEGKLPHGVYAKDVILHIIGELGTDYAIYKAVEFSGSLLRQMNMSERMVLCNMTTEMGAKAAYIQPDEVTLDFLKNAGTENYEIFTTDKDFQYKEEQIFNVSDLKPQLAVPSSVGNVMNLADCEGTPINQAYLGSCTGGRLEDLALASEILKGRSIHKAVRMVVAPASRKVLLQAIRHGYMEILINAGAAFVTPGCAACLGIHEGILAGEEVCISSANRNFPGRMGHTHAKIYLGSPAAVAASALEGKIADPIRYLNNEKEEIL